MKTDSRSTQASERRQTCFDLRKAGLTFAEIGLQLGISAQASHGLIKRELIRLNKLTESDAEVLRELELVRLDCLLKSVWDKALQGDLQTIDRVLKISKRRSELSGIDTPAKSEIDLQNNGPRVVAYIPDNGRPDDDKPTAIPESQIPGFKNEAS